MFNPTLEQIEAGDALLQPPYWRAILLAALALGFAGLVIFVWGLFQPSVLLQNGGFACCIGAVIIAMGTCLIVSILASI